MQSTIYYKCEACVHTYHKAILYSCTTHLTFFLAEVYQYPCYSNDSTRPNCHVYSSVFSRYTEYHKQVVTQQIEGTFLKYVCTSSCGGYGNRIEGITMALMLAILSNRTLLIEMTYPFDINILLHPNAIQWNYKLKIANVQQFMLIDDYNLYWPRFSEAIFNPSIDLIEMRTNLGLFWFFKAFDDKWTKLFHDVFSVSQNDHIFSYGCAYRYLFTYDKRVTDAIDKEMQQLQLTPGKYVSVHYRTRIMFNDALYGHNVSIDPFPYFKCGIKIADKLGNDYRVYFISDLEEVDKMVTGVYADQIVTSQVNKLHVDRFEKHSSTNDSLIHGFVGVLVNIEVAAKGAAFIRVALQSLSNMADLIEGIGQFSKCSVVEHIIKY